MIKFRPALGLTLGTLAATAVLLWLGFWQVDRLSWKLDLIDAANEGLSSAPVALEIWEASRTSESEGRYSKVTARGTLDTSRTAYLYATGPDGPGYKVISPMLLDDGVLLVDRGFVSEVGEGRFEGGKNQTEEITGLIQLDGKSTVGIQGAGLNGVWTYRDVESMSQYLGVEDARPFMVVVLPSDTKDHERGGPMPLEPNLEFTNNHLSYAMTWFGLVFALLSVYICLLYTSPSPRDA